MIKKNFIITLVILSGAIFGIFLFAPATKTFYIKNSASYLSAIRVDRKIYQAEDKIGDMQNTIIPSIKIPENLSENFAGILAKEIIGKNDQPKDVNSPAGPGLNMPDINKITEEFVTNGLKQANENILNIKQPEIKTSPNNSKEAIELYLAEAQKILKDNLNGEPLLSILEEINKNNGGGLEKLLTIISAHEDAANQIEERPVPSSVKDLMTEEIQLLRITANVLRALTNIETDPLGTIAAIKQFGALLENWVNFQNKFNTFIKKLNQT
ncbi:MAG: hypothetical protein Q7K16_01345 [Candidatus Azambacteria bacterium]|nr:hypothetical protein [Candidatus Azambacteria bacterium]